VIDYQRDLFISGDFDRVVYCSHEEYLTISMICFSVVTYQWRVFHSLEFGTQRPYQNYNNNIELPTSLFRLKL